MSRRPALVTQEDVTRAIRAMQSLGLEVVRVVVRRDGVSVETRAAGPAETQLEAPREIVL